MTPTSNKILVIVNGRPVRARLRSWGDDAEHIMLYWRSWRYNGHVRPCDEHVTWVRGWFHDAKTVAALCVVDALS